MSIIFFDRPAALFEEALPLGNGKLGAAAGIAEMLMQSDGKTIRLLPALPSDWQSGEVRGLRAKGGAKVNIKWKNGKITYYEIKGGRPCKVIKCR